MSGGTGIAIIWHVQARFIASNRLRRRNHLLPCQAAWAPVLRNAQQLEDIPQRCGKPANLRNWPDGGTFVAIHHLPPGWRCRGKQHCRQSST
jgi:hypothetical protein